MSLDVPVRYRVEYPLDPAVPARARECARALLIGVPGDTVAIVELVVSELVTNGLRHTVGPTIRLTLDLEPGCCRVSVADQGAKDGGKPSFDGVGPDDVLSENGRGLPLVAAVCAEAGVDWSDWNRRGLEVWGRVTW